MRLSYTGKGVVVKLLGLFILIFLAILLLFPFTISATSGGPAFGGYYSPFLPAIGAPPSNVTLGVVELSEIISAHKLSYKLYQLDTKIAGLEDELYIGAHSFEGLSKSDYIKVQDIHQKAKEELEKEIVHVKAQIKQQEIFLTKKMKALEEETARALKEVKDEKTELKLPQKLSSQTAGAGSNKFVKELIALRDRQIAAKRLELQKELEDILRKGRMAKGEALSRFETELLKANQNKKINLQFKYNLAANEEAREKIKKELEEIEKEEAGKKQIKLNELEREHEKLKNTETRRIEKELLDYQKKLEQDLLKQLKSRGLSPSLIYSSSERGKIVKKYEAARKKLEQELIQARATSIKKLDAKRKELEKRLEEEEKRIIEQAKKQQEYLSQYREKQQGILKSELEKLKVERKKIYNSILSDVAQIISKIAKEEGILVVLGRYMVNIDCEDLTDLVLMEMRKGQER